MRASQRAIRAKARALEAALHDSRCDNNLSLFVDTDVVMGVFFRFGEVRLAVERRQLGHARPIYAGREANLYARTLWSTGYTQAAQMLCAHASELLRRTRVEDSESHGEGTDRMDIEALSKSVFSTALKDQISQVLSSSAAGTASSDIGQRLESLLPTEYLALLAASLPHWRDRLRLVGDQLVLPDEKRRGVFLKLLEQNHTQVDEIAKKLELLRAHGFSQALHATYIRRAKATRNSYVDACAMLELNKLAELSNVIFFTTTTALAELAESQMGQDLLPNLRGNDEDATAILDGGVVDRPSGCMRSATYMELRAACPAVAFGEVREPFAPTNKIDEERNDIQKMIESARRLIADRWASGKEVAEWHQAFDSIGESRRFQRVWATPSMQTLPWLANKLPQVEGLSSTMNELRDRNVEVIQASFERLADVGQAVETVYQEAKRLEMSVNDTGVGRWLLIATHPFGQLDKLVRAASKESAKFVHGFRGLSEQWSLVMNNPAVTLETQATAAAHLFARGRYDRVCTCWPTRNPKTSDERVVKCLEFAITIMRQCAELEVYNREENLDRFAGETTAIEAAIIGHASQSGRDAARARCIYAMQAWRAFYFCRDRNQNDVQVGRARERLFQLNLQNLDPLAPVCAELKGDSTWQDPIRHGVGDFQALLEWPVIELLAADSVDRGSHRDLFDQLPSVEPNGAYGVDARAWRIWKRKGSKSDSDKRHLAEARFMAMPRETEKYFLDHRALFDGFPAEQ